MMKHVGIHSVLLYSLTKVLILSILLLILTPTVDLTEAGGVYLGVYMLMIPEKLHLRFPTLKESRLKPHQWHLRPTMDWRFVLVLHCYPGVCALGGG